MRIRSVVVLSLSIVGLLAGCGGETPPPETPPPPPSASAAPMPTPEVKKEEPPPPPKKEEPPPPPPKKSAKEILMGGGTFMFSLADSPDAKKMHADECAKKSKKQEKIDACMKDVDATASVEGIRHEKDDKGVWHYVSFGKEKDKEVVYNNIPFKIVKDEDGKVTVAPDGKDTGKRPFPAKAMPKEVVLEIPDENTIVMNDPKKGRLVYKKKLVDDQAYA